MTLIERVTWFSIMFSVFIHEDWRVLAPVVAALYMIYTVLVCIQKGE